MTRGEKGNLQPSNISLYFTHLIILMTFYEDDILLRKLLFASSLGTFHNTRGAGVQLFRGGRWCGVVGGDPGQKWVFPSSPKATIYNL